MKTPYNYSKLILPKSIYINKTLHPKFLISKKPKIAENNIYIVLRPDKDENAKKFFPNKRVVYLRYDKPEQLILIKKYQAMSLQNND